MRDGEPESGFLSSANVRGVTIPAPAAGARRPAGCRGSIARGGGGCPHRGTHGHAARHVGAQQHPFGSHISHSSGLDCADDLGGSGGLGCLRCGGWTSDDWPWVRCWCERAGI